MNMALARAIIGDASDNLPGIRGVGFGTVAKRLGFLASENTCTIDKVIDHCENIESHLKVYTNIVDNKELIEHNFRLMQLYVPQMSYQAKRTVDQAVEDFSFSFNQTAIIKMMRNDGFGELNWETLKTHLNKINLNHRTALDI